MTRFLVAAAANVAMSTMVAQNCGVAKAQADLGALDAAYGRLRDRLRVDCRIALTKTRTQSLRHLVNFGKGDVRRLPASRLSVARRRG